MTGVEHGELEGLEGVDTVNPAAALAGGALDEDGAHPVAAGLRVSPRLAKGEDDLAAGVSSDGVPANGDGDHIHGGKPSPHEDENRQALMVAVSEVPPLSTTPGTTTSPSSGGTGSYP